MFHCCYVTVPVTNAIMTNITISISITITITIAIATAITFANHIAAIVFARDLSISYFL